MRLRQNHSWQTPWCLHHPLKNGYVVSCAVAVLKIDTMCANLPNQSIIPLWLWQTFDEIHAHIISWHELDRQWVQKVGLLLVKDSVHLEFHPNLYKVGYIFFMHSQCSIFDTTLWWLIFLYGQQRDYKNYLWIQIVSTCVVAHTLWLYLSNPSTNSTSLSALPLQSSPRSIWQPSNFMLSYAMAIYLSSTIYHRQRRSPLYAPQKICPIPQIWAWAVTMLILLLGYPFLLSS